MIGEAGLLIEGPSGSGKSSLALALLDDAGLRGGFARLVGDDRVEVKRYGERLVACPHPLIAGVIERRGLGLVRVSHEPACVLRLLARLVGEEPDLPERLPEKPPAECLLGINLPVLTLLRSAGARENSGRVLWALQALAAPITERF